MVSSPVAATTLSLAAFDRSASWVAESRPNEHAVGAEHQRCRQAASVSNAAGGQNQNIGHPLRERIHDRWHKRHCRPQRPAVATGLDSLRHHDVRPDIGGAESVLDWWT
jgi:hypothetical protein